MIQESPCSKCVVFPMCQKVCTPWRTYMSLTWSVNHVRDKYAKIIFMRTLAVYGTIDTEAKKGGGYVNS